MQQAQLESLPAHYLAVTESAKLYEPGECYAEFARNLPRNLPKERLLSDPDNTRYGEHAGTDSGSAQEILRGVSRQPPLCGERIATRGVRHGQCHLLQCGSLLTWPCNRENVL